MFEQIKAIFELYADRFETKCLTSFNAQDSILAAYHDGLLTFEEMRAYYAFTLTGEFVKEV